MTGFLKSDFYTFYFLFDARQRESFHIFGVLKPSRICQQTAAVRVSTHLSATLAKRTRRRKKGEEEQQRIKNPPPLLLQEKEIHQS